MLNSEEAVDVTIFSDAVNSSTEDTEVVSEVSTAEPSSESSSPEESSSDASLVSFIVPGSVETGVCGVTVTEGTAASVEMDELKVSSVVSRLVVVTTVGDEVLDVSFSSVLTIYSSLDTGVTELVSIISVKV